MNNDKYLVSPLLRIRDILGDPLAKPPIQPLVPVCKSTWWNGVKSGRFPKPVKLGPRITAWHLEDIRALIESANGSGQ